MTAATLSAAYDIAAEYATRFQQAYAIVAVVEGSLYSITPRYRAIQNGSTFETVYPIG